MQGFMFIILYILVTSCSVQDKLPSNINTHEKLINTNLEEINTGIDDINKSTISTKNNINLINELKNQNSHNKMMEISQIDYDSSEIDSMPISNLNTDIISTMSDLASEVINYKQETKVIKIQDSNYESTQNKLKIDTDTNSVFESKKISKSNREESKKKPVTVTHKSENKNTRHRPKILRSSSFNN